MNETGDVQQGQSRRDISAVNYRRFGIVLLLFYLLFPTVLLHARLRWDSRSYFIDANAFGEVFQIQFYLMAAVAFALAFTRKAGRDWQALDRGFGLLLLVAGAMMAGNARGGWWLLGKEDLFLPRTLLLAQASFLVPPALCLLGGCLCFLRIIWAAPVLALLVGLMGWLSLHPVNADGPGFLELKQSMEFRMYAGDRFLEDYKQTRTPEEVAALFAGLDDEASAALEAWVGAETFGKLVERGDDTAFLQRFFGDAIARRSTDGTITVVPPPVESADPNLLMPVLNFRMLNLLFVTILLYAVWRAYRQHYEKRTAAVV